MTTQQKSIDVKAADNIRILSAAMVEKSKSGHPGGAMGGADFMHVLYTEYLRFDPTDMNWPFRDRFFLDPGHMSPLLYSTLSLFDLFSLEDLKNFRQWGSHTPGHPEKNVNRGIENTSGPLGQGHTMAVGAAIAERFLATRFGEWSSHKTYTYISDGGVQEEISQAAGRLAGHLGLSNLIMFYDSNSIQLSTVTSEVTSEDTAMKYKAWGWNVMTIDGNDIPQIFFILFGLMKFVEPLLDSHRLQPFVGIGVCEKKCSPDTQQRKSLKECEALQPQQANQDIGRCRKRSRVQPEGSPLRMAKRHGKFFLNCNAGESVYCREILQRGMVAAHHQMLSVVHIISRFFVDKRIRPASAVLSLLDEKNGKTGSGKAYRRRQSADAAADDNNIGITTLWKMHESGAFCFSTTPRW